MTQLTSFITAVLALSVASERVVELLKGMLPNFWPFKPSTDPSTEARRCAAIRMLSGICGAAAAYLSNIDLFGFLKPGQNITNANWHSLSYLHIIGSIALVALLTSAGSAFWNHALDIVKATKVQQEQTAITSSNANTTTTKALA